MQRRVVKDRREEQQEDDVRLERDLRQVRDEARGQPAEHQEDRVRHAEPRRQVGEARDGGEQAEDGFDRVHR